MARGRLKVETEHWVCVTDKKKYGVRQGIVCKSKDRLNSMWIKFDDDIPKEAKVFDGECIQMKYPEFDGMLVYVCRGKEL
jgi:hypothetical protein